MIDKISEVLLGDVAAVDFFMQIHGILHLVDDLTDRDKPVSNEAIEKGMWSALVDLPRNPFYRRHFDTLNPIVANSILNWGAANEFEKHDDARLEIAFVIRSDYANVLIQSAYLVGGKDWAVKVTPIIRQLWTRETFQDYLRNLSAERYARAIALTKKE